MVLPGVRRGDHPIATGLIFRQLGKQRPASRARRRGRGGFLMVGTIVGILMAMFLNNAGGAWDNAKKYIETGAHGGKRSEPHKAAVVGDTVGDPFKDTAGPSLHVLIKLLSTITLVLAPLFCGGADRPEGPRSGRPARAARAASIRRGRNIGAAELRRRAATRGGRRGRPRRRIGGPSGWPQRRLRRAGDCFPQASPCGGRPASRRRLGRAAHLAIRRARKFLRPLCKATEGC
jgi:hypothetical protein